MKQEHYQEWLADKRQVQAPEDFVESVMAASMTEPPAWRTAAFWAKAALFFLAVCGGIGRYAIAAYFVFFG